MFDRTTTLQRLSNAEVEAVAEALTAMRSKVGKQALAKLNDPKSFDLGKKFFDYANSYGRISLTEALPAQAFLLGIMSEWHRSQIGGSVSLAVLKAALPFFIQLWTEARDAKVTADKAAKSAVKPTKRGKLYVGSNGGHLFPETVRSYQQSYGEVYQDADGSIFRARDHAILWHAPK